MANVYRIQSNGKIAAMQRLHCKDEKRELQDVLEQNADLLPGDQISPEDPRRWLLIKREMPVPHPETGIDHWSIDFVYTDQDAVPTFVECKRHDDTRARREIVGQLLEYAANGHHYWDKDTLLARARETAKQKGSELDQLVASFAPTGGLTADAFFDQIVQNLREGQLRLVFFLEEASMELRSIVDFLNKQMERTEVLLVEARMYSQDDARILVPSLFGYSEQARAVKRIVTVSGTSARRVWDYDSFFLEIEGRFGSVEVSAMRELVNQVQTLKYETYWGAGRSEGNFIVRQPNEPRAVLSLSTTGRLTVNLGWLPANTALFLRDEIRDRLHVQMPEQLETPRYPSLPAEKWTGKVPEIINILEKLTSKFGAIA